MKTRDLVLEVGCEEIPHDLLEAGREALRAGLEGALEKARLKGGDTHVEALATPRRLAAIVRGLPERQATVTETVMGPARKVAVDANGAPTRAGEGFARGQGVAFADLIEVDTEKGVYVAARKTLPGQAAGAVLAELLPAVLGDLHWAKTMHWGAGVGPFVRPVRWLCAVLGDKAVHFEFAGVRSGASSRGHRFFAPRPFRITGPEDYLEGLRKRKVEPDPAQRQKRIHVKLAAVARDVAARSDMTPAGAGSGRAVPDPDLEKVTAAKTEWPVAVAGGFDPKYLELPREVLITSMREHQDDFAVEDAEGALLPAFVTFADNQAPDPGVIARGNERVLRARLEDARFFFNEDRKRPLGDYAERLGTFLFQKDLGSVADKVARITSLAEDLAPALGADPRRAGRAAALCKCDLVTDMVYEFPELQGVMGRIYALASGEPTEVAEAIAEHYLPDTAGGPLPASPTGRAVAIADKLDTLCGIFGVGLIPSGSQDPYALRRAGLGVVRILAAGPTGVNLVQAVGRAAGALEGRIGRPPDTVAAEVVTFLAGRLAFHMEQRASADNPQAPGVRYDVAQACIAAGIGDVHDAEQRARALDALRRSAGFEDLMTSFRRVMKIIPDDFTAQAVDPEALPAGPERALWEVYAKARGAIRDRARPATARLQAMAALRPQVDAFFEAVLVMDPDPAVRARRLSMLAEIRDTFRTFADFGQVAGD